jgi:predicted dehydrogenase
MNFLIIGLGSMGKRRIRCLQALGYKSDEISGWDVRKDRRDEIKALHSIKIENGFSKVSSKKFDCIIISVPPDYHNQYIKYAIDHKIPAFVEASVILEGLQDLDNFAKQSGVLVAPSCTLQFHSAIQDIRKLVQNGEYGKVTNFSYHCGQYLPDWHPWEKIQDYYVSQKSTGGAREIVPFELTWIVDLFGIPRRIVGLYGKTLEMGVDIDDTYVFSMEFDNFFGNMTIDVVSRYATRSLILNLEKAQITWNWDEKKIRLYDAEKQRWIIFDEPQSQVVAGYNKNISDDMYIRELKAFVDSVKYNAGFPNTLEKDIQVLQLLHRVEGEP